MSIFLIVYLTLIPIAALIVGFVGPDEIESPYLGFLLIFLWPVVLWIMIGALIRDLTDTLRYNRRKR